MKFYKIEGVINDSIEEESEGKKYSQVLQIRLKTQEYNRTHEDSFVCVARMKNGNTTIGSICVDKISVTERVNDYLTFLGLSAKIIYAETVTMKTFFSLVNSAVILSYLSDENSI